MKGASTSILLALGLLIVAPNASQAQQGTVYVQPPPQQQYQQAPPQYGQPQQQYVQPQYAQPQPQFVQAPGQVQPRTEQRSHVGMIVGGTVVLGVSWLLHGALISPLAGWSADRGYQLEWESFRYLGLVPVLGPWIQLAIKPSGLSDDSWGPYLVVNGILQAGGLALLIVGASVRETDTVYGSRENGGPYVAVGATGNGLQLTGAF